MDFGEILSKAWKTIWKHKILWLFGILAGCGAAQGGGASGGGNAVYSGTQQGNFGGSSPFSPGMGNGMLNFFQKLSEVPVVVWVLIAIFLIILVIVLSLLAMMLGSLGTAGVIKGASMADRADPGDKPLSLGQIFKAVKPYFWKVFLFQIGIRLVASLITLLLLIPIMLLMVCTCCFGLFLLIPVGWFIDLMVYFTLIAILEEDKDMIAGIQRAWQLITRHLGKVVVLFLILAVGQFVLGVLFSLPFLALPIPILINLAVTGFESFGVGLIISIILFILAMPVFVLLTGILKAYILTSWTLTYRRLLLEEELQPVTLNDGLDEDSEVDPD